MKDEKGKWYELSVSLREVSENDASKLGLDSSAEGIRTKSASQSFRDNWDNVFGKKEESEIVN